MLSDNSLTAQNENELAYTVLSDVDNTLTKACGLVFTLDQRLVPVYHQLGLDIPKTNRDNSYELPLSATYVIDQNGIIQFAFAKEDYTLRAEPEDILLAVEALTR